MYTDRDKRQAGTCLRDETLNEIRRGLSLSVIISRSGSSSVPWGSAKTYDVTDSARRDHPNCAGKFDLSLLMTCDKVWFNLESLQWKFEHGDIRAVKPKRVIFRRTRHPTPLLSIFLFILPRFSLSSLHFGFTSSSLSRHSPSNAPIIVFIVFVSGLSSSLMSHLILFPSAVVFSHNASSQIVFLGGCFSSTTRHLTFCRPVVVFSNNVSSGLVELGDKAGGFFRCSSLMNVSVMILFDESRKRGLVRPTKT